VRGDRESVSATLTCILDADVDVKAEAIRVLGHITEKGDQEVVGAVSGFLEDDDESVSASAIRTLLLLTGKGDESFLFAVRAYLKCSSQCAFDFTMGDCIKELIGSKEDAVSAVRSFLDDKDADIRSAAIRQLGKLADKAPAGRSMEVQQLDDRPEKDDSSAMLLFRSRLLDESEDSNVRREAAKAFAVLVGKGDDTVIPQVTDQLNHRAASVRAAALVVLGQLAEKGSCDDRVINCMSRLLEDENEEVRFYAMATLGILAPGKLSELVEVV